MKKAQVANEFVILLGVGILIIMIFLSFLAQDMEFMVTKKEMNVLHDIGLSVQTELFTAANLKDGYIREFEMPQQFRGVYYNATISSGYLIMSSERTDQHQEFPVPEVVGDVHLGMNRIVKKGGVLYLN